MATPLDDGQANAVAGAFREVAERGHLSIWQLRAVSRAMADRGLYDAQPDILAALDQGDRRIVEEGL
jgi:hypothetical protein